MSGVLGSANVVTQQPPRLTQNTGRMCSDCSLMNWGLTSKTVAKSSIKSLLPEWTEEGQVFAYWPRDSWSGEISETMDSSAAQTEADLTLNIHQPVQKRPRDGLPHDGLALEVGEVVYKTHDQSRWTKDWGWCLHWRLSECFSRDKCPCSDWGIVAPILSKTRPCRRNSIGAYFSGSNMNTLYGEVVRGHDPARWRGWDWSRVYTFVARDPPAKRARMDG